MCSIIQGIPCEIYGIQYPFADREDMKFLGVRARTRAVAFNMTHIFVTLCRTSIRGILLNLIHRRKTYAQVYAVFFNVLVIRSALRGNCN